MKRVYSLVVLHSVLAATLPLPTSAAPSDRTRDGVIAKINGSVLEVCFRRTSPPAIGDTITIVREWIPFSKGTPATPRYSTVGHARVTGLAQAPCVTADMLDGTPKRYDRARPASEAAGVPQP